MFLGIAKFLLSKIGGDVFTRTVETIDKIIDKKHEMKMVKLESDIAITKAKTLSSIEMAFMMAKYANEYDIRAMENRKYTCMDELIGFMFAAILISCFIPFTQEYVLRGFGILKQCPAWFVILVVGWIASTLGIRWIVNMFKPVFAKYFGVSATGGQMAEKSSPSTLGPDIEASQVQEKNIESSINEKFRELYNNTFKGGD